MASADWVAKVCSSSIVSGGKSPGRLRLTTRLPINCALAEHGHRQDGPDAGLDQGLAQPALVGALHGDVRHLDRLERDRRAPQHAFPLGGSARRAAASASAASLVGRCPVHELLGALVVLEDHAPVEPRELDGAGRRWSPAPSPGPAWS